MVAFFCYFDFSLLQSMVVPVWGWLNLDVFECRKFSPGGLQVRVGGVGERDSEDRLQRISSRIYHIDGRGSKKASSFARMSSRINDIFVGKDQQQDQPIIARGSRRTSTSFDGERKVVHFRQQNLQNLKYHTIQVVYFLTLLQFQQKSSLRL